MAARAAVILTILLLAAGFTWWVVDERPFLGVRTNGPIKGYGGGSGWVGGSFHGEMKDWADVRLTNTSDDPATITDVRLLPGYGSENLMQTAGFFVLGLDRAFGGGMTKAPSDATYWGVEPAPAIGYQVPGADVDIDGIGVELLIRLGIGDDEDGSFLGIEVYYAWHGHEYKVYFNKAMLICDHDPAQGGRPTGICRGEHPPPKPID